MSTTRTVQWSPKVSTSAGTRPHTSPQKTNSQERPTHTHNEARSLVSSSAAVDTMQLVEDIWDHILLRLLDVRGIVSLSSTCKQFHTLCSSERIWSHLLRKQMSTLDIEFAESIPAYRSYMENQAPATTNPNAHHECHSRTKYRNLYWTMPDFLVPFVQSLNPLPIFECQRTANVGPPELHDPF
jgi:hypothetical protein